MGQQGLVQVAHELEALRQQGVERGGHLVLALEQAQVMEIRLAQPGVHVTEGILVGHQVDEALLTVGVQLDNVVRREAIEIRRLLGVSGVLEAIALHVQLELVVLQRRQEVDHHLDGLHAGLLAAADIDHVAAAGQGGFILDFRKGQHALGLAEHLLQGGRRAEQAFVTGHGDGHALPVHGDVVFFLVQHRCTGDANAGHASLDRGIQRRQGLLRPCGIHAILAFLDFHPLRLGKNHHVQFLLSRLTYFRTSKKRTNPRFAPTLQAILPPAAYLPF